VTIKRTKYEAVCCSLISFAAHPYRPASRKLLSMPSSTLIEQAVAQASDATSNMHS
jgi:hypothetical protein